MASPQLSGECIPSDERPPDESMPIFYVGHHESRRPLPISDPILRQAQDIGVSTRFISLLIDADKLSTICLRHQLQPHTFVLESSLCCPLIYPCWKLPWRIYQLRSSRPLTQWTRHLPLEIQFLSLLDMLAHGLIFALQIP